MLTLIESIRDDNKKINDMDAQDLKVLIQQSIDCGDFKTLRLITNMHTGIYHHNERAPWWLSSNFDDDVWRVDFNDSTKKAKKVYKTKTKKLDWNNIYLDDGKLLTNEKHKKLLNSFKYWITAVDNPLENGGKIINATTARTKCLEVISLINTILLHSELLRLSQFNFQNINDDFWLNIFGKMVTYNGILSIYNPDLHTKKLLDKESESITDEEEKNFKQDYPYLCQAIATEDTTLFLNNRIKACLWLFKQGFYKNSWGSPAYQGNGSVLTSLLFNGKLLSYDILLPAYPELFLKPPKLQTEYRGILQRNRSSGLTPIRITQYLSALRLIQTNFEREDAAIPPQQSTYLTVSSIQEFTIFKKEGRTKNQPPEFVFKFIRQCYEFAKEHLPEEDLNNDISCLLSEVLNFLVKGREKSTKQNTGKIVQQVSERHHWFQVEAIKDLSTNYKLKGVKQIQKFSINTENKHKKIRENQSLFDLFDILQGTIQVLVGVIMARRQDELITLKSHGNLSSDISPFSSSDLLPSYNLKFQVKKTGIGGQYGTNETIERPIPLSIAKLIWQIEQFNIEATKKKVNKGQLSLFNNLDSKCCQLNSMKYNHFNDNLDAVCDYFETDLVQYDSGEYRRNYVRQHQLRRFFSMVFFWSKGFDGMESLSWMLAHSDIEHLYHYITESEPGAVLVGAKATVIQRGLINSFSELSKLEGIEKVRKAIAKRLLGDETKAVEISTLSDASEYYEDESYLTIPHISKIKKEQDIENEIINMLEVGEITLEPDFFTIKDSSGDNVRTFNLILKVKDLD
jgi:hypothetical protein